MYRLAANETLHGGFGMERECPPHKQRMRVDTRDQDKCRWKYVQAEAIGRSLVVVWGIVFSNELRRVVATGARGRYLLVTRHTNDGGPDKQAQRLDNRPARIPQVTGTGRC